ncbi:MAG TPA: hypothetical protein VGJ91_13655 [Polyangiaceae bacterium]
MEDHRLAFSGLEWTAIAPGARHKMFERDGKRARLLEFSREFVEVEWCRKGHVGVVLKGVLELEFDGRIERFEPGDGLFIAAGETGKHKARAISERVSLFLVEDA